MKLRKLALAMALSLTALAIPMTASAESGDYDFYILCAHTLCCFYLRSKSAELRAQDLLNYNRFYLRANNNGYHLLTI